MKIKLFSYNQLDTLIHQILRIKGVQRAYRIN